MPSASSVDQDYLFSDLRTPYANFGNRHTAPTTGRRIVRGRKAADRAYGATFRRANQVSQIDVPSDTQGSARGAIFDACFGGVERDKEPWRVQTDLEETPVLYRRFVECMRQVEAVLPTGNEHAACRPAGACRGESVERRTLFRRSSQIQFPNTPVPGIRCEIGKKAPWPNPYIADKTRSF